MKKLCILSTLALLVAAASSAQSAAGGGAAAARPGASQGPPPPSPAAIATPADYVVGAQDILKVTVFDEPTMSGTFRVDNDGTFQYPMLGRVKALGLKPREIADYLKTTLQAGYINNPQVAVEIEEYRSRSLFVIGEVRAPGKYPMTGAMTLLEALAAAGSPTPTASTEVLILRPKAQTAAAVTPDQDDQANVTRVNLAALQLGRLSENVPVEEGDTVFVPKAEKFYMTGQVRNPGAYTYERGQTVLQAISLAGGLTDKGSNRRIKVIRVIKGKRIEDGIDLDYVIQPGDTIVVPQRLL